MGAFFYFMCFIPFFLLLAQCFVGVVCVDLVYQYLYL